MGAYRLLVYDYETISNRSMEGGGSVTQECFWVVTRERALCEALGEAWALLPTAGW